MLLLKRRRNERIRIGETIVVEVMSVQGETVTLGVTADDLTEIDREEVWVRKQQGLSNGTPECREGSNDMKSAAGQL